MRQVTYALLTRSQLIRLVQAPDFSVLLACIRQPAFVLSGSNSHKSLIQTQAITSFPFYCCFVIDDLSLDKSPCVGSSSLIFKGLVRYRALATTILVYHFLETLSTLFETFL